MAIPASGEQLLVSEMFVSLQGEGVSAGAPAAFLRLGNCNLSCVYCDTPYTWDDRRYDLRQELVAQPLPEVAKWIVEHAPGRLIVTGGEPLLQHKLLARLLEELDERMTSAARPRLVVEVETNGTVWPGEALLGRVDQWNVSPKLAMSGEPLERRFKPKVVEGFAGLPHAYFKFVVATESDVSEVLEWVAQFGLAKERVLLMPEATSADELRARAPAVASWALGATLRYSGRVHLELYGGRRGT